MKYTHGQKSIRNTSKITHRQYIDALKEQCLLIIFSKNLELGTVKTRLAKTIGNQDALEIYTELVAYTERITVGLQVSKVVYYSSYIDDFDVFDKANFSKKKQYGEGLGERMKNAFKDAFEAGYSKVVIIGTDCYELTKDLLEEAFLNLTDNNVVIGPAEDGGYYLLGMNTFYDHLFAGKQWSSENVFLDTILDLKQNNSSYYLLKTLSDVDEEKDLGVLRDMLTKND